MTLLVNGRPICYKKTRIPLHTPNLLHWLSKQTLYPKIYWQDKEGKRKIAGVGKALEFTSPPCVEGDPDLLFFGGCHFDHKESALWKGFPSSYFFLPKYEICDNTLTIHQIDNASFDLNELITDEDTAFKAPQVIKRGDSPSLKKWELSVKRALKEIKKNTLAKVILARKSTFNLKEEISPFLLLSKLNSSSSTVFGFELTRGNAFIGSTPEMLYKREEGFLFSEALAASAKEVKFLKGKKEKREFEYVSTFIVNLLESLCEDVQKGPIKILNTGYLHHKYLEAKGKLQREITDKELLELLHPTPAIGGEPRKEALMFIHKEEPFARGWYASPVGFVGANHAEFVVGIRSCLIKKKKLHLFAGAGIIEGSDPGQEWDELEAKIFQFTNQFGA